MNIDSQIFDIRRAASLAVQQFERTAADFDVSLDATFFAKLAHRLPGVAQLAVEPFASWAEDDHGPTDLERARCVITMTAAMAKE